MTIPLLARDTRRPDPTVIDRAILDDDHAFMGVRCPLCSWRPSESSRWYCHCGGTPEPHFESCGTVWNTFATGGVCPGCAHEWQWTSCLRCGAASLHRDWYENAEGRRRPHRF